MSVRLARVAASLRTRLCALLLPSIAACAGSDAGGDGTGDPAAAGSWDGLVAGEVQACAAPLAAATWTEAGASMGLTGAADTTGLHEAGGGVAVTDFDADGLLDIVMAYPSEIHFYRREGAAFQKSTIEGPLSVYALTLHDVDGDGRQEVLLGGTRPTVLRYSEGAIASEPLTDDLANGVPTQAFFGSDIDTDGNLDFYAMTTNAESTDYLVRGVADGSFVSDRKSLPAELGRGVGFDAQWFDWDGDLDLDLYLVNDRGAESGPNVLFENVDGTLVDASADCLCGLEMEGMGVDVGDYDADGDPDMFVTASAASWLLQRLDDGTYVSVGLAAGIPAIEEWQMGWGAVWSDLDNDGQLDIAMARGDLYHDTENPNDMRDDTPQVLRQSDGRFTDVTAALGMDRSGSWRSVVPVDLNGDGVLDPILTHVLEPPLVYLSDGCTAAGWLEVEGPEGSRVEVEAGGRTQTAWITTHSGMGGARPPVAHFGLGAATEVDALRVTLPDGTVRQSPSFEGRRRVVVE